MAKDHKEYDESEVEHIQLTIDKTVWEDVLRSYEEHQEVCEEEGENPPSLDMYVGGLIAEALYYSDEDSDEEEDEDDYDDEEEE